MMYEIKRIVSVACIIALFFGYCLWYQENIIDKKKGPIPAEIKVPEVQKVDSDTLENEDQVMRKEPVVSPSPKPEIKNPSPQRKQEVQVLQEGPARLTEAPKEKEAEISPEVKIPLADKANPALKKMVKEWLGAPYKYAGNTKEGTDCSGFTQQVYEQVYQIKTARTAYDMYDETQKVALEDLQEGDMVFFKIESERIGHVGVYLHDGYFVHATTAKGVKIDHLDQAYYKKYFFSGGRFTQDTFEQKAAGPMEEKLPEDTQPQI